MSRRVPTDKQLFDAKPWHGKNRKYDIVKEGAIAVTVVSLLVLSFSLFFGSPDEKPLTFKGWATSNSDNFYATAASELAGTSTTATYGAPYNKGSAGLNIGPLWLQKWVGVTHPIDTVNDFLITPLTNSVQPADVASALTQWNGATSVQKSTWATKYDSAIAKVEGKLSSVPSGDYGPVPALAKGLTDMA